VRITKKEHSEEKPDAKAFEGNFVNIKDYDNVTIANVSDSVPEMFENSEDETCQDTEDEIEIPRNNIQKETL